uniref:GIY-YIG endonuclease n=1 Tax=Ramaria rubella TaxID=113071 RepID=UPI002238F555|nr:GIY-YIG endonuclease [Ramaria rubella]UYR22226.1 GIY-YIG endonuclease [Ramaria rubella]
MPRVLEQAYILHYKPELNGNKKSSYQVIFNFLKWDSTSLTETTVNSDNINTNRFIDLHSFPKFRAADEDQNILASSVSMNGLASLLGLSLSGLKYHFNRESTVWSKSLGLSLRVYPEGIEAEGKPKYKYDSKKKIRMNLE